MSRFPFPDFPVGWFRVADAAELPQGLCVPVRAFRRELVCYGGQGGVLSVAEAFCPHNGAHLGYGGRVEGDELVCPFHGWRFDRDGVNVGIPYSARAMPRVKLRHLPTRELAGLVFAWYDPTGSPPSFELPELPEADDDRYVRYVPGGRAGGFVHAPKRCSRTPWTSRTSASSTGSKDSAGRP